MPESVAKQLSSDMSSVVNNKIYCILHGQIKGFNRSITTILCQVGSYRTVV